MKSLLVLIAAGLSLFAASPAQAQTCEDLFRLEPIRDTVFVSRLMNTPVLVRPVGTLVEGFFGFGAKRVEVVLQDSRNPDQPVIVSDRLYDKNGLAQLQLNDANVIIRKVAIAEDMTIASNRRTPIRIEFEILDSDGQFRRIQGLYYWVQSVPVSYTRGF